MKEIADQIIQIHNKKTNDVETFTPLAVESCMVPETFHITPILKEENKNEITYSINNQVITISKSDVADGSITIEMQPFHPKIIRKQGGCKPCTNCGRCSW